MFEKKWILAYGAFGPCGPGAGIGSVICAYAVVAKRTIARIARSFFIIKLQINVYKKSLIRERIKPTKIVV
jgi:hypothetical protein